jgi:hypothetical protein
MQRGNEDHGETEKYKIEDFACSGHFLVLLQAKADLDPLITMTAGISGRMLLAIH